MTVTPISAARPISAAELRQHIQDLGWLQGHAETRWQATGMPEHRAEAKEWHLARLQAQQVLDNQTHSGKAAGAR